MIYPSWRTGCFEDHHSNQHGYAYAQRAEAPTCSNELMLLQAKFSSYGCGVSQAALQDSIMQITHLLFMIVDQVTQNLKIFLKLAHVVDREYGWQLKVDDCIDGRTPGPHTLRNIGYTDHCAWVISVCRRHGPVLLHSNCLLGLSPNQLNFRVSVPARNHMSDIAVLVSNNFHITITVEHPLNGHLVLPLVLSHRYHSNPT